MPIETHNVHLPLRCRRRFHRGSRRGFILSRLLLRYQCNWPCTECQPDVNARSTEIPGIHETGWKGGITASGSQQHNLEIPPGLSETRLHMTAVDFPQSDDTRQVPDRCFGSSTKPASELINHVAGSFRRVQRWLLVGKAPLGTSLLRP